MNDDGRRHSRVGRMLASLCFCLSLVAVGYSPIAAAAEKWQGVDEAVVQKLAAEHGRQSRPLFELEGDAQLFAFLLAGAVGGFAAGYWWRMLVAERRKK